MECCRTRPAPREIDQELLWLLVSLGAFLGLAAWLTARLPTPQCAFHALTGLPCVTCGSTRAAWQFLHGHFAASFHFNPLAFLAYCGIVVFDLYAATVLLARAPRFRLRNFSRAERTVVRVVVVALLAANWVYLLVARPF
jgi:Protein of unknown function (DUF2752)